MFDIYGYNKGTVISNINYENINNKPALNGKELTKESKIEDYQEEIEKNIRYKFKCCKQIYI